jgi:hypothetical protein
MTVRRRFLFTLVAVLFILLVISSGCTSIPGPAPRAAPAAPATPTPEQVAPLKTLRVSTPSVTATLPPVTTGTVSPRVTTVPVTPPQGIFELRTCSQQGGGIAVPGQVCPGTWLIAADTFSCCPVPPVRPGIRNASVTVEPFVVLIQMDDDPGSITP